jgi:hypothetical protein
VTPEADIALAAIVVAIVSGLVATVFALFTLRVRDLEEKTISRELFQIHQKHVDDRLDKQDKALESHGATLQQNTNATNRALGILERLERKASPPPRSYGG